MEPAKTVAISPIENDPVKKNGPTTSNGADKEKTPKNAKKTLPSKAGTKQGSILSFFNKKWEVVFVMNLWVYLNCYCHNFVIYQLRTIKYTWFIIKHCFFFLILTFEILKVVYIRVPSSQSSFCFAICFVKLLACIFTASWFLIQPTVIGYNASVQIQAKVSQRARHRFGLLLRMRQASAASWLNTIKLGENCQIKVTCKRLTKLLQIQ